MLMQQKSRSQEQEELYMRRQVLDQELLQQLQEQRETEEENELDLVNRESSKEHETAEEPSESALQRLRGRTDAYSPSRQESAGIYTVLFAAKGYAVSFAPFAVQTGTEHVQSVETDGSQDAWKHTELSDPLNHPKPGSDQ